MRNAIVILLLSLLAACGAQGSPPIGVTRAALSSGGWINVDDYGCVHDGDLTWGTGTVNDACWTAAYAAATATTSRTRNIHFGVGIYRFSHFAAINHPVHVTGELGGSKPQTTILLDPWSGGVVIHGLGQVPAGTLPVGTTGDGTVIEDLGVASATTFVPSFWKVGLTKAANLTVVPSAGYGVPTPTDPAVTGLLYTVQNPVFVPGVGWGMTALPEPTWCATVGCTVVDAAGKTWVSHLPSPGISAGANHIIQNVYVSNVFGNGYEVMAGGGNGAADEVRADMLRVIQPAGHGVYIRGGEVNCAILTGTVVGQPKGWGMWVDPFLNATLIGPIVTASKLGPYRQTGASNHASLIGAYAEGGQPPTDWRFPGDISGGILASGFTSTTTPLRDSAGNVEGRQFSSNANGRKLDLLPSQADTIFGWTPGKRADGTTRDGGYGWSLIYDYPAVGWIGFSRANLMGVVPFAFSTADAPEGAGHFWVNGDSYTGVGATKRKTTYVAGAPSVPPTIAGGNYAVGDRCINTTATVGQPSGWQVVNVAGVLTWRSLGAL